MPGKRFLLITTVFIINALVGIANAVAADGSLNRWIPAVCWSAAAGIWISKGFRKGRCEKES